jgi:signal peptidase I
LNPPRQSPTINAKKGNIISIANVEFIRLIKDILGRGASLRFSAGGGSMIPFIIDGDVLTLVPLKRGLSYGGVYAFIDPQGSKLIVHRLIGRKNGKFIFKGDNNPESDNSVPLENVLGKVVRVERGKKRVRLGLGVERVVISLMSRKNMLLVMTSMAYKIYRFTRKVLPCL